jgi:hypothetical protein
MHKPAAIIILCLCAVVAHDALAQPDRDSLIEAWETYIQSLPGTVNLEKTGDDVYQFQDADLPYEGELRIVGALVRPAESATFETSFQHLGMVDIALVDLPADRLSSQVFYYWLADRQTMYYSETEQRWVDPTTYQTAITEMYSGGPSFGALSFMLNYGFWIVLIGLLVFGILAIRRQTKKAHSLMDDSSDINQKARENIDRAQSMQDEVLALARETRDLQTKNNELLKQMLDVIKR